MAKQIDELTITITSSDEGTTKTLLCTYRVKDDIDAGMQKVGKYVEASPIYTKTVNQFYSDLVAAVKTQEGIV